MTFIKSFKKFMAIPPCGCKKTRKQRGKSKRRSQKKRTQRGGYEYSIKSRRSAKKHFTSK